MSIWIIILIPVVLALGKLLSVYRIGNEKTTNKKEEM